MTPELVKTFLTFVAVLGVAAIILWGFVRSDQILDKWAADNGYKIIQREYKFFWNILDFPASRGQTVYHVIVVDDGGNKRSGMVRCGGWVFGILENTATVKWDV